MAFLSQDVLERARQVGEHYTMEVVKSGEDGTIEIKLLPKDDWGRSQLSTFIDSLTNQLCSQFYTYFGIRGKIIDVE